MPNYEVRVKTGDKKGAGTDANVKIRLHDKDGNKTRENQLDVIFRDDFEQGNLDEFKISDPVQVGKLEKIELWRDNAGLFAAWYVEYVEVIVKDTRDEYMFPIHRWIHEHRHYHIRQYDAILPQDDPHVEQREFELSEKRKLYQYHRNAPNVPVQVKKVPEDEQFSDDYRWDIEATKKAMFLKVTFKKVFTAFKPWETLQHLTDLFRKDWPWGVQVPRAIEHWRDDSWFGAQRLSGCNPVLIRLCKQIPENLGVTPAMMVPFLEGLTLEEALDKRRIYMVDLKLLEGVKTKDGYVLCAPIALFFVKDDESLVPIAIQLNQEKGPDNPVFLPNDDANLWLLAKMWYNLADATYHQSLTHLCFTHLKMESITVCTNRNLSPSHPIYKLLAPHFLFLIAIDARGLALLISKGGHVDKTMSVGREGMLGFIGKGSEMWRMDRHGHLPNDLKNREVDDPNSLPNYHYRDDGMLVWGAVERYVRKVVCLFYESADDVRDDSELQQWAKELVTPYPEGVGLKGVPGNGKFEDRGSLIEALTCIIFNCSAMHAAVNFSQYDEYAFVPNYPGSLEGKPPTKKEHKTEADIMATLPSKSVTLDTVLVVKILSTRGTQKLGDFEVKYLHQPEAERAAQEMIEELNVISNLIKEWNQSRKYTYDVLDPEIIPNSISI